MAIFSIIIVIIIRYYENFKINAGELAPVADSRHSNIRRRSRSRIVVRLRYVH